MSMAVVCNIALPIMFIYLMFNVKKFSVMMKTMIYSVIAGALAFWGEQSWLRLRPFQGTENIDSLESHRE